MYLEEASKQSPFADTSVTSSGIIRFTFPNTITAGSVKAIRVQDIVTWNIISTNRWQRPIYFAVTCSPDSKIGLERYFRMDGLAARLVPIQAPSSEGIIVDTILAPNLYNSPAGYSKTFQRGYKYRGLADNTVYYDENVAHLTSNYRNAFLRLAMYHLSLTHDNAKALAALDSMEAKIPHNVIPIDYRLLYDMANFYRYAGAMDKCNKYADEVTRKLLDIIRTNPSEPLSVYNPYVALLSIYESRKEYRQSDRYVKHDQRQVFRNYPGDRRTGQAKN